MPVLLFTFFTCMLFSCDRKVDGITGKEDEKGIDQFIASDKLNTVENEKSSRSEHQDELIEINGVNFLSADSIYKTADSLARTNIELLINGYSITDTSTTGTKVLAKGAFGWIIKSINNVPVANKDKKFNIFYLEGKYHEYNNALKEAAWGYCYINPEFTQLGLDLKNSSFNDLYTIETISETQLVLSKDEELYEYEPYVVEGVSNNNFVPVSSTLPTN